MPQYIVQVTEIASCEYEVEAESADEARAKINAGTWDRFRDLGHDDMTIHAVKESD